MGLEQEYHSLAAELERDSSPNFIDAMCKFAVNTPFAGPTAVPVLTQNKAAV